MLSALQALAPTVAVRGNVDRGDWAEALPISARLSVNGVAIHVIHNLKALDFDPGAVGVRVVVSGHTHQPRFEETGGVLYVNPGAAGPRRFRLPVTVCQLGIDAEGNVEPRLIDLAVG